MQSWGLPFLYIKIQERKERKMVNPNLREVLDIIESALTLSGGYEVLGGENDDELLVICPAEADANIVVKVATVGK